MRIYWYDVCNDYSLDLRATAPNDLHMYKMVRGMSGGQAIKIYVHKQQQDVHYIASTEPLKVLEY